MRGFFLVHFHTLWSPPVGYPWVFLGALAYSHISGCLFAFYFINIFHDLGLCYTLVLCLLRLLQLKLRNVTAILNSCISGGVSGTKIGRSPFNSAKFSHFRFEFVHSLLLFFEVNRMFGPLFLSHLLGMLPLSLVFGVWLIQGETLSLTASIVLYAWELFIANFLFVLHLLFARATKRIHRPAKPLLAFAARNQFWAKHQQMPTKTQVHLACQIATLHTKKRYGFTYGSFGLVSMMAFFKVNFCAIFVTEKFFS